MPTLSRPHSVRRFALNLRGAIIGNNIDTLNAKILVVDDDTENVAMLEALLQHAGYTSVDSTNNPKHVLAMHAAKRYDLIILDLQMPGLDGFGVMEQLKTVDRQTYLSVLAVTGEHSYKLRALQAGAKDLVSKPFDCDEVLMRVHNMLEVRLLHEAMRRHAQTLEMLALHDPLTGLANRRLITERLSMAIAHARRNKSAVAVFYMDLDSFKAVNDTLGHAAGDQLLKAVAKRLVSAVREEDTVGRIGGDEFMIALWQVIGVDDSARVAAKLIDTISKPYQIAGQKLTITTSIGASLFPVHGKDVDSLMTKADGALYEAKRSGKNAYRFCAFQSDSSAKGITSVEASV